MPMLCSIYEKIAEIVSTPDPGAKNSIKDPADSGWRNEKVTPPKPKKPAVKPAVKPGQPKDQPQPQPQPEKKPEEQKPPQNPNRLELNLVENKNRIEKKINREQQMLNKEQQRTLKKNSPEDAADVGQDHLKKINDLSKKKNMVDTKLVNVQRSKIQRSKRAISGLLKDIAQRINL